MRGDMARTRLCIACGAALLCIFLLELAARTPPPPPPTPSPASDPEPRKSAEGDAARECLQGAVWVGAGGRLGNAFMAWASALGVARALARPLLVDEAVAAPLRRVFAALPGDAPTLREFFHRHERRAPDGRPCALALRDEQLAALARPWPGAIDAVRNTSGPVLIPKYANLAEPISLAADEIRRGARFHAPLQQRALRTLAAVRAQVAAAGLPAQGDQLVFVGVHARRTDYPNWMRRRMGSREFADEAYFVRAVGAVLRGAAGAGAAALILASDDMAWVRSRLAPALERAFASPAAPPADGTPAAPAPALVPARAFAVADGRPAATAADLALLAACNHSVIAYGTFGMAAALLAGGATVAFDTGVAWYGSTQLAAALPGWTLVK